METTPTTIRLDNDLKRKLNKELKSMTSPGKGFLFRRKLVRIALGDLK